MIGGAKSEAGMKATVTLTVIMSSLLTALYRDLRTGRAVNRDFWNF
jgi:hypothetical protein